MAQLLKGKTAVVTGASEGIGLACAEAYLEAGAQVVAIGRSPEKLSAAFDAHGSKVLQFSMDLLDDKACQMMVPTILERVKQIDLLHANAGMYVDGDITTNSHVEIDNVMKLNGPVVMKNVRDVLNHMKKREINGDILVTSSLAAHYPTPWEPVYAPSKRGIDDFVQIVRRQERDSGIRIGSISPGPTLTALTKDWDQARLQAEIDKGAVMEAEQIADAAMFMVTRKRNMTVRDMVIIPTTFDL